MEMKRNKISETKFTKNKIEHKIMTEEYPES